MDVAQIALFFELVYIYHGKKTQHFVTALFCVSESIEEFGHQAAAFFLARLRAAESPDRAKQLQCQIEISQAKRQHGEHELLFAAACELR